MMKKWIKKLGIVLKHWLFWWCVCVFVTTIIVATLVLRISQEGKERIVYKESPKCYVYGYWEHRTKYYLRELGESQFITDSVWHPFPPESCKIDTVIESTTVIKERLLVSGKLRHEEVLSKTVTAGGLK